MDGKAQMREDGLGLRRKRRHRIPRGAGLRMWAMSRA